MKLNTRDAAAFLKAPRDGVVCVLLFGPEAMRTAITRQDLLKTVLGANAEEDMRLTRMTGGELRSDAAALQDAMKAIGFFPGRLAKAQSSASWLKVLGTRPPSVSMPIRPRALILQIR